MSETLKVMVPKAVKWVKWTGDNLDEIREFWAEELTLWPEATISADPETGNLVVEGALVSIYGANVGRWVSLHNGVADDWQMPLYWREV